MKLMRDEILAALGFAKFAGEPDRAEALLSTYEQSVSVEANREGLREARRVIMQYLVTAEKWRYDRVMRAFGIMLGEIPEDTPEPLSPSDEAALRAIGE